MRSILNIYRKGKEKIIKIIDEITYNTENSREIASVILTDINSEIKSEMSLRETKDGKPFYHFIQYGPQGVNEVIEAHENKRFLILFRELKQLSSKPFDEQ